MDKEEKLKFCIDWIARIDDQYSTLNQDREKALLFYRNDPEMVKVIEGRSQAVTTDLQDTVEWLKPAILEIFTGGNDIVSLEPTGEEDVEAVKNQELLINKQVRHKNQWFKIMHDVLQDALLLKYGAVKYQWLKHVKYIEKRYEGLTEQEFQAKSAEKNIEIMAIKENIIEPEKPNLMAMSQMQQAPMMGPDNGGMMQPGGMPMPQMPMMIPAVKEYDIECRYKVEDEYPLIEAVPAENIKFPINIRDITTSPFLCHIVYYNEYEFRKKFGQKKFEKVEEIKKCCDDKSNNVYQERFKDVGGVNFLWNDKIKEWIVHECFYFDPETSEPRIFKFCGDEELVDEKNRYGKPSFRGFTPIMMSHRVIGMSFYDLIWQIQRFRTGMLRQFADSIWKSNFRRYFGNKDRVDMDAFYNNNTANAFIHVTGDPNSVIMPEQKAPMAPESFQLWSMILDEKDYHVGVPRAFQGINPNVLNETFRGQNQQINQAGQRIQLLARIIAEIFVAPLMEDMVELNLKFLQKKTSVRYLNKWVEISPDNIIGKADVTVNVGLGTGDKPLIIGQIQQLLGLYGTIHQTGIPVVTAQNVFHAMKELVKAMGFKDTANWVTDPKLIEAVKGLMSMVSGFMQQTGQQDPKAMQLLQQIGIMMGMSPKDQEGAAPFPGQNTPQLPTQPTQANQPVTTLGGGSYFG